MQIELLAPAQNAEYGITAIKYGADAVYIGAAKYGARAAVGNSLKDIERLCEYAHKFNAKVYVTVNTLLYDKELSEVEKLIWKIYEIGADAIIVQDMALLEMSLPPIQLFASTQTNNISVEKIKFLEKVGFQRVILARELPLGQIKKINKQVNIELESFIHGALCVCYSGQCYMSHAISNRSANRGECSQPCRMLYDFADTRGKYLARDKHLLSLRDLNLSNYLNDLIDAGVNSFKIEGRLKDISYVKNVVGSYRKQLDEIISQRKDLEKTSSGNVNLHFEPDLKKTFNRGYSDYFIEGRKKGTTSFNTPKSLGKKLGIVTEIDKYFFTIETDEKINTGDGICFFDEEGKLCGSSVNRVEGKKNALGKGDKPNVNSFIYRNLDQEFNKILQTDKTERKIPVNITFSEIEKGFSLHLIDENGIQAIIEEETEKQVAKNVDLAYKNIEKQLSKLGDSIFSLDTLQIKMQEPRFIPAGILNSMRRNAILQLEENRLEKYERKEVKIISNEFTYPEKELDYRGNVLNNLARKFYESHGVNEIQDAFEKQTVKKNSVLMTTKHCLKFEFNICPKQKHKEPIDIVEPLWLMDRNKKYRLEFDCKKCEMKVILNH